MLGLNEPKLQSLENKVFEFETLKVILKEKPTDFENNAPELNEIESKRTLKTMSVQFY